MRRRNHAIRWDDLTIVTAIDQTDRLLLAALAANGRVSLKQLASAAGLSSPSAAERLRKLEERGIIRSYSTEIDPKILGLTVEALVRIRPLPGRQRNVREKIEAMAEVAECDSITGEDCFMARIFARSMEHLDSLVEGLADEASTNTSIVKRQIVGRRSILPATD